MISYLDVKIPNPYGEPPTTYLGITKQLRAQRFKLWKIADKRSGWHDTVQWLLFTDEGKRLKEVFDYYDTELNKAKLGFIEYARLEKERGHTQ